MTTSYVYNGLGKRVKKSSAGVTRYFAYDEAGHLLGEYDAQGDLVQETVWLGDIPVATLRPDGSGGIDIFYVHTDHLNTPRRVTRPVDNVVVWRWLSSPFGVTDADQDPDGDQNMFAFNLRFPGQYYDEETGLHYNYFRTYDPSTGRYLESDPIGLDGGLNTYGYVSGNPMSFTDPFGLAELPPYYPISHRDYYYGANGDYYDTTGRPRPAPGPGGQVGAGAAGCVFGLCASRDFVLDEYARLELSSSTLESGANLFVCFSTNEVTCERDPEGDIRNLGYSLGVGRRLGVSIAPGEYCINLGVGIGLPVEKPTDLGPIR